MESLNLEVSTSPFLRLPAEIRQAIYDYALLHDSCTVYLGDTFDRRIAKKRGWDKIMPGGSSSNAFPMETRKFPVAPESTSRNALVLTYRQIYLEADSAFFYRNNVLSATSITDLGAFMRDTRAFHLQAIEHLEVFSFRSKDKINPRNIMMLKPFTNLRTLELRDKRPDYHVPMQWKQHPCRNLMKSLVTAVRMLDSLRTLLVTSRYPPTKGLFNWHMYGRFPMDPDDIPGWVYSFDKEMNAGRIIEKLERLHGPHPKVIRRPTRDCSLSEDDILAEGLKLFSAESYESEKGDDRWMRESYMAPYRARRLNAFT